ncbi:MULTISPECIES: xanthine phosphoribosyltransferase [unclassified Hahella]|nr:MULTISPECIES: xanthine phosphoribosyltransferase [unclassified Hahella]AZZ94319.1 xanthine phosphoribosyltransferase [Hahella sp. KA22]MBU6953146.1 xanthine phosphoribosyltransferase [Hahella sp. HN01]MDG9669864.1 xanthine phosphoribosyltransferase [Hahella sp. CR1]QAY57693.1 xanthine phosphoribosyltransferase [Hahella sp. KA22]
MSDSRYHQTIFISWEELHRDTRMLCRKLIDMGRWKGIIAITRGGLIPAGIIARELGIRYIDTVCAVSYEEQKQSDDVNVIKSFDASVIGDGEGYLLVDDLVDTGKTAKVVRNLIPNAFFATLYAKPLGRPFVDLCIKEVSQETWMRFPWDMELNYSTPLVDRL